MEKFISRIDRVEKTTVSSRQKLLLDILHYLVWEIVFSRKISGNFDQ